MSGAAPVQAAFSRLGRAIGHLVGGQGYHDRLRTATFAREALERSGELKRDWNRLVERAAEEGVHVIYTDGYDHLHKELDTVSKNMLLDRGVESEISTVLAQIGKVVSNRNYFDSCREYMAGQMDRREALEAKAAERGVAVPDHEDYDTWRDVTDFAVGRCEGLMDDPVNYGIHLDYIALREESLGSALARVRDVLEDDDRHLAATLAGQRAGESHPDARGAHRPSARRSGEAPGVAPTARRAQGRQAAEQGPAHEHANVGRRPITDLRALLADRWRHLRVGLRWPGNRLPLHGLGAPGHLGNMPQPYALGHRGVPMPRWERRLIAPPRAWVVSERPAHAVPWRQNRRTNLSSP